MPSRKASHAGSWYSGNKAQLSSQLAQFLSTPPNKSLSPPSTTKPLGIISPHAGYSYSGPTAGSTFREGLERRLQHGNDLTHVFVIHPSHHVYLTGVGVSPCDTIETPVGNLSVDKSVQREIASELVSEGVEVVEISKEQDEDEHSGEMQYPLISHLLSSHNSNAKIVPFMIGSTSPETSNAIGRVLATRIFQPTTFTVVSSDFCHWGRRFQYSPFSNSGDIASSITRLDHEGMTEIEKLSPGGFVGYIKRTRNTICGRHPIESFLYAVEVKYGGGGSGSFQFVRYEKSSEVVDIQDSSVSYAGGVFYG
mmetsp:Transcript_12937/g.26415  ORF Transcript_12937/g.26415 Transcript_12937/m.26415 type:complete len:309 (-) Transcript_12937:34-960(-)